ncbi:MAG: MMPL family transporter [Acidobacteriota bacterium]
MSTLSSPDSGNQGLAEHKGLAERWVAAIQSRPWTALLLVALLTLAAASGGRHLTLRMDGRSMVPPDDPIVEFDAEVRDVFGVRDQLVVLVESRRPDGIFDPAVLERLIQITDIAHGLDGVEDEHVVSLATERRDRVYPGTLRFRPFLDPLPDNEQLLEVLRADIAAPRVLDGTLVSHDRGAAAIFLGVPDVAEIGDRGLLYRQLVEQLEPLDDDLVDLRVVGAPAAEALLGHHILEDMQRLLPLSMVSMALLMALLLGRLWGMVLGLIEVGACLAFTFGLMGWFGVPISLTSGVLPLVLISLGLADEIHLVTHYQKLLARSGSASAGPGVLQRTYREILPPILTTSLTTSLGFASFIASPIEPIRQFGAFAAVGILYCLVFSTCASPAILHLLGPDRLRARRSLAGRETMLKPVLWVTRRPGRALAASLALAFGLGSGITHLVVQDGWIDGFAPDSKFRRDSDRVADQLLGTHILLIHLAVEGSGVPPEGDGREGWLLDPELLREVGRFEDHLRSLEGVGGVLGPASQLSAVSHLWHARKDGTWSIPDDVVKVGRVYRFFDLVRGKHRRREVVNDDLDRALVSVFLRNANYRETQALIEEMTDWSGFESHAVELSIAGDVAVSQAMIPAIVRSQVISLSLALAGSLFALVLLLRAPGRAILAITPVILAVVCVFGAMGWLGIPLGVATSMFCAITLGVGVDYAVHLVAARRRAIDRGEADPSAAAVTDVGPAILIDFLVIAIGFGWMSLSQVPSNGYLGILVVVALGLSCVFTLIGLRSAWAWRSDL